MTSYTHKLGDIEYDVDIDGDEVTISHVYTDIGMEVGELYFSDPRNPMKMINLEHYMCDKAYQAFRDEFGGEDNLRGYMED